LAKKEISESKIIIKQFRDSSSNFWCDNLHYHLNELGELILCAGGLDKPELREALVSYIKRNKKSFKAREKSQIEDIIIKQYSVIGFGKYSSLTTQDLVGTDKKYAKWAYENVKNDKIKEELKELLKIK
jgi:hypothetical protein